MLSINTNLPSIVAGRNVNSAASQLSKSMERLSSGLRINRAADDAAGLGIASRMRGTLSALDQAERNAQDAISLVQTADGALGDFQRVLSRMRDLALQKNNDVYSTADLDAINAESDQLAQELSRLSSTDFNGQTLFGTSGCLTFQIGANTADTIEYAKVDVSGIVSLDSTATIGDLDTAIQTVTAARSSIGAMQNRLDITISGIGTYRDNLTSAKSRIEDVDVADEMATFTRLQIRQQAAVSMLAQANQAPSIILSLLGR